MLVMLLNVMNRHDYNNGNNDFEEFLDLYSVSETCVMLVQILSDFSDSSLYLYSRRLEDKLLRT